MSAPVDVLAVLDRVAKESEWQHEGIPAGLTEARAAIAELIEAADKLQRVYQLMDTDPDFVRLRTALRACGGAA